MRPTFMGFETASRGMMAQQKALDIVGNNVGNIGVTGYTRQRVDMVSMSLSNTNARFSANAVGRAGQGVNVTGVSQIRDPFLDKRFREEYADVGYYSKMVDVLGDIEDGLNEIEPSNMTEALESFKIAWTKMQKEEGKDPTASSTLLASARTLTQVFKQLDSKINSVWEQQKYDLQINTNSVNSILSRIADLNDTIQKESFAAEGTGSTSQPNELLDARNVLLDQLSEFGDIQTTLNPDNTVTVKMGASGHVVVDGKWSEEITMVQPAGSQTVSVKWQTEGAPVDFNTGSIKASLDMLNGRGTNAQPMRGETFENGVLYYRDMIDKLAVNVAKTFNNVIAEYDDTGKQTGLKTLFSFTGDGTSTAGNITVNKEWEANSNYILENVHKPGEGIGDTGFADRAVAAFSEKMSYGGFTGTFSEYVSYYTVSQLGNQVTHAQSRLESCSAISDKILSNISAVSGVSMEEEGVDMVQYTKAYNAMGRVMTALDEALDTLINKTGLVGR
ncbi:MAG: flagellar hook-associated protein FlgK [Oscillospiraceae bacterium]